MNSIYYVGTYNLPSLDIPKDRDLNKMVFGRQIEYIKKIHEWKKGAKKVYLSQKRQTFSKAIKEFKNLHKPKNWFTPTKNKKDSPNYWDDGIEVYYEE